MSPIRKLGLAGVPALVLLVLSPACHLDQLQTARIISEGQGQLIVAMPENTPAYRKIAEKIAREKLGPDWQMVSGKEVVTEDNVGKEEVDRRLLSPNGKKTGVEYRREYHLTFVSADNRKG